MTLDEILKHRAPCYIILQDSQAIYCQRMNAGDHPAKGPTVRIVDAEGDTKYLSAEYIIKITNAPPLPR